jgi:hypothetical protein
MSKADILTRVVDAIGNKIPETVAKHPAATAGGLGVILGASQMQRPVQDAESELILEQMGGPASKYSADLDLFSHRKTVLAAKLSFIKKAEGDDKPKSFKEGDDKPKSFRNEFVGGFGKGLGGGVTSEGLGAIRRLLGATAQTIKEKFVSDPRRQQILDKVIESDPLISSYAEKNPGSVQNAYDTMIRFAPELSTDPNVVTAFLRHASMTGGVLDHATVKGLADAEASIHKAKNEGAWLRGGW